MNVGLQRMESTATQTSERKDVQELSMVQEGLEHTREVLKDDGQASDEKKDKVQMRAQQLPSTSRQVVKSIADLYTKDGMPDEWWCRVIEETPNE